MSTHKDCLLDDPNMPTRRPTPEGYGAVVGPVEAIDQRLQIAEKRSTPGFGDVLEPNSIELQPLRTFIASGLQAYIV